MGFAVGGNGYVSAGLPLTGRRVSFPRSLASLTNGDATTPALRRAWGLNEMLYLEGSRMSHQSSRPRDSSRLVAFFSGSGGHRPLESPPELLTSLFLKCVYTSKTSEPRFSRKD